MNPRNLATNPNFSGLTGRAAALAAAQDAVVVKSSAPYFSRFKFVDSTSVGGTLTFQPVDLRCFAYGLGDQMAPAISVPTTGPQPSFIALESDTNLAQAGTPNNGEDFVIKGASILWNQNSDPALVKALTPEISISLRFGTQLEIQLGSVSMVPGSGGQFGSGESTITGTGASFFSNGYPDIFNCRPLKEGIRWRRQGTTDSNLTGLVRLRRQVGLSVAGEVRPAGPFVLDGIFVLHGYSERKRSVNL
jgi:hypothetical protein